MRAHISQIDYHLPEAVLDNSELAAVFGDWSAEKIADKTGISQRRIAAKGECASDLAFAAADKLLTSAAIERSAVDFLLLCTQSPDYFLPTTACLLQSRLGLSTKCGALDFNLGCSGYVYGLGLAKGLIESGQARNVLLLTGETYSKYIHPGDRSVRTLFGDAGSATLVQGRQSSEESIGPFIYGTDGAGAENLIVSGGAHRHVCAASNSDEGAEGSTPGPANLYMNGAEIFSFTLKSVPAAVNAILQKSGLAIDHIDLFVFHQANEFMLKHLRNKIGIPEDKFVVAMKDVGNTVSATIPIALKESVESGRLKEGMTVLLVGFGVGYSWGANILKWSSQRSSQ
jgi:3-oxoacyl-[acyl-carrier-protein] synthase-3